MFEIIQVNYLFGLDSKKVFLYYFQTGMSKKVKENNQQTLQTESSSSEEEIEIGTVKYNLQLQRKIKKRLDRSEKLYIHSLMIYILSFRCLSEKEAALYKLKFDQFTELMSDICNIPFFDEQRHQYLMLEAQKRALRFSYKLHFEVLQSWGIQNLASRGKEDQVFIQIDFGLPSNSKSKSIELFQTKLNGQWMPKYHWFSKKFDSLEINVNNTIIDTDSIITVKLIVVKQKRDLFSSIVNALPFGECCRFYVKSIFPIVALRPSEITWSGLSQTFSFTYSNHTIHVVLKIKWKLKGIKKYKLLSNNYSDLEGQMFQQFLSYRWKKRFFRNMVLFKCSNHLKKVGTLLHNHFFSQDTWKVRSQFWSESLLASDISPDLTSDKLHESQKFCIASEWCNIHSFYLHNPIARFLFYQNHHLFGVSDILTVPYHFRAICAFINLKNYNCFDLLSSSLKFLNVYMMQTIDFKDQSACYRFWRSTAGQIILDGYFHLRNFLTKPESFKLVSCPFDHYSEGFKYFVQALIWLEQTIYCLEDNKLYRKLRYKFQDLLTSWIIMILNNPNLNISSQIITMSMNMPLNEESNCYITTSVIDSSSSIPTLYLYSMESMNSLDSFGSQKSSKSKRISRMSRKPLVKHQDNTINQLQYHIYIHCSKQVSLLHKLVDFINQTSTIVPFDFYDKQLYKNEVKMTCSIDYAFRTKTQRYDYFIEVKQSANLSPILKLFFLEYYLTVFYSVAFDLQSFIIEHLLYTYYKEFNFDLSINRVKFFATNEWIENVGLQGLEDNQVHIFTANEDIFVEITDLFVSFQSYWTVPLHQQKTLEGNQLFKSIIYECISYGYWIENLSENVFQSKLKAFDEIKRKLLNQLEMFINSSNEKLRQLVSSKSSPKMNETKRLIIINIIKGYCLNLKNICIFCVQYANDVLEKSSERLGFNILCPVWIEILSINDILKEGLEECRKACSKFCSFSTSLNIEAEINDTINTTIKQISLIASSIYITLIKNWLKEVHYLKFKWYKEKQKLIKSKLIPDNLISNEEVINVLRLIVIIGFAEFSQFKNIFHPQYNYLNDQLNEQLRDSELNEIRRLIKTIKELFSNLPCKREKWKSLIIADVMVLNKKYSQFYDLIKSWTKGEPRPYQDELILN